LWSSWFISSPSVILPNTASRATFILSFSALMTTAIHHPKALRGLSRWTLAFVTNGPNTSFWKRQRRDEVELSTPSVPTLEAYDTRDSPIHHTTDNLSK
jgi:hypothetical protein